MTDRSDQSPQLGDVWRYPYLWKREEISGNTEGVKSRPCALALLKRSENGLTRMLLVPVTTKPQDDNPFAIEVPEIEKKRAGLDTSLRLWIVTQEYNIDTVGHSYYFEPHAQLGSFSLSFVKQVQAKMIEAIKARKSKSVSRR